ncbi:MAG: hypothetical protein WCL71_12890 [Deltaproteobacteria bacterium]
MIICESKPVTAMRLKYLCAAALAKQDLRVMSFSCRPKLSAKRAIRIKDEFYQLDKYIVRARIAEKFRTNLTQWAKSHGYNPFTAHLAVNGNRRGPTPRRIVKTLRRELGI